MKMRLNYFWISLPVLLLVAVSALADPKKAGPNHGATKNVTECGTVLTEPGNYKLANDLLDCPEHGILIEGSDITLNFMGHEISCPDGWIGVFLMGTEENTVKNITVKNGHVSNCGEGIALWFAEDSKVMNMTSTGNRGSGIAVWASSNNVIMHNYVDGNGNDGILSWQSSGNLFKHNTSTASGDGWMGAGIALDGETDSRIMCNRTHGNADGILIYGGSSGNLLRGNLVSGNHYSGFAMMGLYWKNPDPPYEEYYYAMPSGNTIRANIVGDNPSDLWEAYWDELGGNVLLNPDGLCSSNTWEKNQFQTEYGPAGCFGIPVELDDHDVCALDYDH